MVCVVMWIGIRQSFDLLKGWKIFFLKLKLKCSYYTIWKYVKLKNAINIGSMACFLTFEMTGKELDCEQKNL